MKTKYVRTIAASAATVLLATTVAFAAAGGNRPGTTQHGGIVVNPGLFALKVSCAVHGTPSEFPDDVTIYNKGPAVVPAGVKVHWSVPFVGKQGNYTLASALQPNHGAMLSGVLGGGVEAGKPCVASVVH